MNIIIEYWTILPLYSVSVIYNRTVLRYEGTIIE
jgi:hypothetical protein